VSQATSQPQAGSQIEPQGSSQPQTGSQIEPQGSSQPQAGSQIEPQELSRPQVGSQTEPQGSSQPQAGSQIEPQGAGSQTTVSQQVLSQPLPFRPSIRSSKSKPKLWEQKLIPKTMTPTKIVRFMEPRLLRLLLGRQLWHRAQWNPDGRGRNRWTKPPPIKPRRAG
jgi:hypothetical protein